MPKTFTAFKLYFDEFTGGINPNELYFDTPGFYFDKVGNRSIDIEVSSLIVYRYLAREFLGWVIEVSLDIKENYSKYVDLLQLIPLKFHDSVLLQEFLDEIGLIVGSTISKIDDLEKIIDRDSVPEDYVTYLADLIGLSILGGETESLKSKRRQLFQAINQYKRKGAYKSLKDIGYGLGLTLNFSDMYTNDYSTFVRVPWFVGYENENPSGLTSDYYKAPHFSIDLILDQKYGEGATAYLFEEVTYTRLFEIAKQVRPINVVNHYSIVLNAITDQSENVITTDAGVKSCITGDWVTVKKNFDDSNNFDDGLFFDASEEAYVASISKWKVGAGHVNTPPSSSDTALESSIFSGLVESNIIYSDRVEINFVVPAANVQNGITELGLFLDDGTTMVAEATFPSIQKIVDVELRVKFIITF